MISNHTILSEICARFEIPFQFTSHDLKSNIEFEAELMSSILDYKPDLIVLAKFMRISSPGFVDHFRDKIINIHHSFLPAFIGAHPYKQAFERGVNHLELPHILSMRYWMMALLLRRKLLK